MLCGRFGSLAALLVWGAAGTHTTGQKFNVVSGPCTTDQLCAYSYNYPYSYRDSERCMVRANDGFYLNVSSFATELDYDTVTLNGRRYSGRGTNGDVQLNGQYMTPGSTFEWQSDVSQTSTGWAICASTDAEISTPSPSSAFTPSPSSAPTIGGGVLQAFSVVSGRCTVDEECAYSPNYPDRYGSMEQCLIRANRALQLSVQLFDTEGPHDYVTVNQQRFSGSGYTEDSSLYIGGQAMWSGNTFEWATDGSVQHGGWALCEAGAAAPTLDPTRYPTRTPTVWNDQAEESDAGIAQIVAGGVAGAVAFLACCLCCRRWAKQAKYTREADNEARTIREHQQLVALTQVPAPKPAAPPKDKRKVYPEEALHHTTQSEPVKTDAEIEDDLNKAFEERKRELGLA